MSVSDPVFLTDFLGPAGGVDSLPTRLLVFESATADRILLADLFKDFFESAEDGLLFVDFRGLFDEG